MIEAITHTVEDKITVEVEERDLLLTLFSDQHWLKDILDAESDLPVEREWYLDEVEGLDDETTESTRKIWRLTFSRVRDVMTTQTEDGALELGAAARAREKYAERDHRFPERPLVDNEDADFDD